jgi:hypothetical protein
MDLDIDFEIKRLRMLPGDILVIKLDRNPTEEVAAHLQRATKEALPRDTKIFVLTPGISLSVLSPQEARILETAMENAA